MTKVHSQGDFKKLADEVWEWRLKDNPEFASNVGDQRYMDKVEDYSIDSIDVRKVRSPLHSNEWKRSCLPYTAVLGAKQVAVPLNTDGWSDLII